MDERPDGEGPTSSRPPEPPPAWSPPDAGAPPPPPGATGPLRFEPDAAGPPPPPGVRTRRRRWIVVGIVAAVVLVVGVPVGLAVAGWSAFSSGTDEVATDRDGDPTTDEPADPDAPGQDDPDASDPDGDEPGAADPDEEPGADDDPGADTDAPEDGAAARSLDPLDLDDLDGVDATYGQLLTDVDASELVMMAFQDEIAAAFTSSGTDPDALAERIQGAAGDQRARLLEVRDRLEDTLDDDGAETVRERYVVHLDSWADYMEAVEQDVQTLAGEGDDAAFNLAINTTADAFARSLEEELPDDVDDDVRRMAEEILDRGFSGGAEAQV